MYSRKKTTLSTDSSCSQMQQLMKHLRESDAVVIGAGSGLSTAAGFTYSGKRFKTYFADFIEKYDFKDMYSAGFFPYPTLEEYWAYWSRYIYINRYQQPPGTVYQNLLELIREKDYFVLTTNVDHCFQKTGFDKQRLFYTQGDYGLWQCSKACHPKTYDNEIPIRAMVTQQKHMRVPSAFIPYCPRCGAPMTMNLRIDETFVEDEGWHAAAERYQSFLSDCRKKYVLYLELGVGYNTAGIIKYPFWQMVYENNNAVYVCINLKEAFAPAEIERRSICIEASIDKILETAAAHI